MASFRDRIGNIFLSEEKKQLREAASLVIDYINQGPKNFPPELLLNRLSEIDPRYMDLVMRQVQAGVFQTYEANEIDRMANVYKSRQMYDNDVVTEAVIDIWTDFGFGLTVDIIPRNDEAKEFWKDFWDATENSYLLSQREINNLSTQVLRDGDFLFLMFTSTIEGTTTLRIVPTDQIKGGSMNDTGIITMPDDAAVPVLYRREIKQNGEPKISYYIDWRATEEMLTAVGKPTDGEIVTKVGTEVRAMFISHRTRNMRGWPLMTTGIPWAIAYRDFLKDRVAIARAVSMFVDKVIVDGGEKAINQVANRLASSLSSGGSSETNPRPPAGATWLENKAATRERMDLTTGAQDAETDGVALLAQAGLAGRVYAHYLGRGANVYRLATATSMERPLLRAFNRYQLFWASIWRDLAKYVLMMGEKYAPDFSIDEEYDVDISMNSVIDVSIEDVSKSTTSLTDLYDRSLIETPVAMEIGEQLMRVIMQTIGIDDIEDIFSKAEEEIPETPEDEENPTDNIPPPVPPGEEEPPDNEVEEAAKRFVRLLNKKRNGK